MTEFDKKQECRVVYICSEGRPWVPSGDGSYKRIEYKSVPSIASDKAGFRKAGEGVRFERKPYDKKNGF